MHTSEAYNWLTHGQGFRKILIRLNQPMTAKQLIYKTEMTLDYCSYTLSRLCLHGLAICMNKQAKRSRLFWLTELGQARQRKLREELNLPQFDHNLPGIDWQLYGWVCYNHRSIIIKSLDEPMQPSEIKRRIKNRFPKIKISSNNIRDVIKLFLQKEIVKSIKIRKKAHVRYELTKLGLDIKKLLYQAELYF